MNAMSHLLSDRVQILSDTVKSVTLFAPDSGCQKRREAALLSYPIIEFPHSKSLITYGALKKMQHARFKIQPQPYYEELETKFTGSGVEFALQERNSAHRTCQRRCLLESHRGQ